MNGRPWQGMGLIADLSGQPSLIFYGFGALTVREVLAKVIEHSQFLWPARVPQMRSGGRKDSADKGLKKFKPRKAYRDRKALKGILIETINNLE
jgi:hypothetical protein